MRYAFRRTAIRLSLQEEKVDKLVTIALHKLLKSCIVLKIYSIQKPEITETLNLRAGSHFNLNYSSNDVKWGNNGNLPKRMNRGLIVVF